MEECLIKKFISDSFCVYYDEIKVPGVKHAKLMQQKCSVGMQKNMAMRDHAAAGVTGPVGKE